ncbi:methyltransferase [Ascodesmis nigricans]|uniref:Methyltransferase n=1 Tax=Ascodesmis nigricans TaxID=341454 RepID=A0A4S2N3L6_9PEZI|nr:methyltransferase [Ascodesmis nigricans]
MSNGLETTLPIEADPDAGASDYESQHNLQSSTASMTSSMYDFVYENGRQYHRKSADQYAMPSDETEKNRLDMFHHAQLCVLGGALYTAPIDPAKMHNVLDCGTGTGIWALDFGEIHENAKVTGVDLMPIQPTWTYPNVVFETDDLEKNWTYEKNHFDFIHSRHLGMSMRSWERYIQQCFDHTKPGGWLEISEHTLDRLHCDDGTLKDDSAVAIYYTAFRRSVEASGLDCELSAEKLKQYLRDAGYVDVSSRLYKVPWGPWPRNKNARYIGAVGAEVLSTGLEAYGMNLMTKVGGLTKEEASKLIVEAMKDIRGGQVHGYHKQWQVIGRKPEVGDE